MCQLGARVQACGQVPTGPMFNRVFTQAHSLGTLPPKHPGVQPGGYPSPALGFWVFWGVGNLHILATPINTLPPMFTQVYPCLNRGSQSWGIPAFGHISFFLSFSLSFKLAISSLL